MHWSTPDCRQSQGEAASFKGYNTRSAWRRWPRWDQAETDPLRDPHRQKRCLGQTPVSLTNTICRPRTLRDLLVGHMPSSSPNKWGEAAFLFWDYHLPTPCQRGSEDQHRVRTQREMTGASPGHPAALPGFCTGWIRAPWSRRLAEHHLHRGQVAWKRAFVHLWEALPARRGWINGVCPAENRRGTGKARQRSFAVDGNPTQLPQVQRSLHRHQASPGLSVASEICKRAEI